MKRLVIGISAEGSVVLLEGQLRYFKDRGYETFLLSPLSDRVKSFCDRESCTHLVINIKRDISPINDLINLGHIFLYLLRYKPDIINLGTPKVSLLGMVAAKLVGIPKRLYTCRGFRFEHEKGLKRKILILMEKMTVSCSHKVICISPSVRDYGVNNGIFKKDQTIVINKGSSNGFNLKRFSPENISDDSKADLKKTLGLDDKFVYGFVGRIYDRKGINELYKAFSSLDTRLNNISLLIVGRFEESQIADKRIIGKIKEHNHIILAGSQKNIPLYLSVMDVFVMPAWGEGFGNVLIEAAAIGIPVISTDVTGTRDAVQHNFNGLLVEPKSVEQLTEAMLFLYNNKEVRESFGNNGVEWAKNFDNNIIWRGMDEIYNSAI